jgi:hypothetical protein
MRSPLNDQMKTEFAAALAALTEGSPLTAEFGHSMPWLSVDGCMTDGYWVCAGYRADPLLPECSWQTFVQVERLITVNDDDITGEYLLDLQLTGRGSREPRLLAAFAVATVLTDLAAMAADQSGPSQLAS